MLGIFIGFCSGRINFFIFFLGGGLSFLFFSFICITKNAKISFSSWLPAATAAPMHVSALVHSSALFTAGVYLLIHFSPSFSYWLNVILLLVSGSAIFIAGLGANFEFDLKRIIALSTLRQLDLMMINVYIGLSGLTFFHLLTHA